MKSLGTHEIDLMNTFCQYNPNRFLAWKQVVESIFPNIGKDVLCLRFSPHVWFALRHVTGIKIESNNPYYMMHRYYKRSHKDALIKETNFKILIDDIVKRGIKDKPQVMLYPIHKNPYCVMNEIYEGHHRLSAHFIAINTIAKVELMEMK